MQDSSSDVLDKAQDPPLSATSLPDGLRSPSISGSTPDHDLDNDIDLPDLEPELDTGCLDGGLDHKETQVPQPQKRKGGRKPIYATSEERKQRNRQAQAAFRERRTEYIKQLENTIKQHEEALATLQASHRSAADECLMLRYKNSLLERILQEKNIDVQVELAAKTGSPNLGPTRFSNAGVTSVTSPGLTRFTTNKYGGRRPLSISAKSDAAEQQQQLAAQTRSPLSHATPASHLPSPIAPMTKSPNFVPQSGNRSPAVGPLSQSGQPLQPLRPSQPIRPQFSGPTRASFAQSPLAAAQTNAAAGSPASAALVARDTHNFFVSPFQNHYDQLDEEYNAQANMLDDTDADNATFNSASYAPIGSQTGPGQPPLGPPPSVNPNMQHNLAGHQASSSGGDDGQLQSLQVGINAQDPILDADPFGLSASMYFPTPYSFDAHR